MTKLSLKAKFANPRDEKSLTDRLIWWFQSWPNREPFPQYQKDKKDYIKLCGEQAFRKLKEKHES